MADLVKYVLAELPRHQRPARYLTNTRKLIGHDPVTTDLAKAWTWNHRTAPYAILRKYPYLKRRFYVLNAGPVTKFPAARSA